ncbi:winged helix-turn-helix domain-containing protein [Solicola gregarius]|uniref:Winged helix DNA-binding domain-containing protein n=1 Tax=Solicola gregarius TaxID=2908642 RepID=A0AA46YJ39_9ACTN|nr:crosslink repair DNA glycosylase YcaQ family protein [Solicola gregarius]UYM04050.1 winged helix DNA-binding domain-containing protein [Solicola gregarius]
MSDLTFTRLQARRVALGALGFARQRPESASARHANAVSERLGLFQIDSINVLARAHYMPLFSRIGAYDPEILHRMFGRAPRRMFEYWAHEASLVRSELYPSLRFRMRDGARMWGSMRRVADERPDLVAWVLHEVAERGPLTAREIEHDAVRARDGWGWNWSVVKTALEYLFYKGEVTSARRNSAFERVYDLPERVLPRDVLDLAEPDRDEAHRTLVRVSARALGIATEQCLRDYFRLAAEPTRDAVAELVDAGELLPARIDGWSRPAYLHAEASRPRRIRARALVSPFDPLVFERRRTEELFGFRYRIEIYVPEAKRVHGYYVLPFLLGDSLVARVDLKADRATGRLLVKGAYAEDHAPPETAAELAAELRLMADWLGLSDVVIAARGDLAPALTRMFTM